MTPESRNLLQHETERELHAMVSWLLHLIFVLGFNAETLIWPVEESTSLPLTRDMPCPLNHSITLEARLRKQIRGGCEKLKALFSAVILI